MFSKLYEYIICSMLLMMVYVVYKCENDETGDGGAAFRDGGHAFALRWTRGNVWRNVYIVCNIVNMICI